MNFTCIYICIYSPSNGFTDPILTKLLPSLHPAALISDQYPALCRLPYSRYSLSNDFDTLVPAGNQKGGEVMSDTVIYTCFMLCMH